MVQIPDDKQLHGSNVVASEVSFHGMTVEQLLASGRGLAMQQQEIIRHCVVVYMALTPDEKGGLAAVLVGTPEQRRKSFRKATPAVQRVLMDMVVCGFNEATLDFTAALIAHRERTAAK